MLLPQPSLRVIGVVSYRTMKAGATIEGMSTKLPQRSQIPTRLTAFVDASVIAAYLAGAEPVSHLFENGYGDRVRFAVDPVVLQEVLTLPAIQESPELLETLRHRLEFEILPLDVDRSRQLLLRAKALRNRIAHSSDVMVAASARDCDYLITYDHGLKELIEGERPSVVTPEQFTSLMATT
jgi:predicted nucleic acid-binding protein